MLSSQMSLAAKRTGWNAFLWGTCIDAPIDLAIGGRTPSSIPPSQRRAGPIRSGRPCHSSARSTCCGGHCVWKDGDRKVRVKPLAGGARALVLFDRGAAHDDPRHLEQLSYPSISARECVTSGRTRICRAGPVRSSDGRTSRGRDVPDRPLTAVNRSGELLLRAPHRAHSNRAAAAVPNCPTSRPAKTNGITLGYPGWSTGQQVESEDHGHVNLKVSLKHNLALVSWFAAQAPGSWNAPAPPAD